MGHKILTKEIINEKIFDRNIELLDEYIGYAIKTRWQCLVPDCNYIWNTSTNAILMGSSCPKCSNMLRLTNEIIDQKLIDGNRLIKRLDDVVNNKTKIRWQCLVNTCNHIWQAIPKSILNIKSNCPKCAGLDRLNNEYIDQQLIGRNIKRLDDYTNNHTNIRWQCLNNKCNNIWITTSKSVINLERGCPKCNLPGKNEKLINKLFVKVNLNYEFQYCIKKIDPGARRLYFDAYFPDIKLAIEYNGSQHYQARGFTTDEKIVKENFINQQSRDQDKRNFCITNNIELIEIDGRIFYGKALKEVINNILIPYIKEKQNWI